MISNAKLLIGIASLGTLALLFFLTVSTAPAQSVPRQKIQTAAINPSSLDDDDDSLLVPKRRGGGRISAPRHSAPRVSRPTPRISTPRISRPTQRISPPRISRPPIHRPTHISRPTWQRPTPVARIPEGGRLSTTRPLVRDSLMRPGNNSIQRPPAPTYPSARPHVSPNSWHQGPAGFITHRTTGQSGFGHGPTGHNAGPATLPRGFSHIGQTPQHGLQHRPATVTAARPNVVTAANRAISSQPRMQNSIGNRVTTASLSRPSLGYAPETANRNVVQTAQNGIGNRTQTLPTRLASAGPGANVARTAPSTRSETRLSAPTSRGNVAQTSQRGAGNFSQNIQTGQGNVVHTRANVVQTTAPANASSPENTRVARADTQTHEAGKQNTVTTKPASISPDKKPERVVMASRPEASSSQLTQQGKKKTNRTFTSSWRQPTASKKDPPKTDSGKKDKKDSHKTDTRIVDLPPAPPSGFTTAGSQYRVEYEPGLERAAAAVNKWAETAHKYASAVVPPNSRGQTSQPIPVSIESRNKAPIVDGKPIDGICYGNRIVLYMPDNSTISNSPVTARDALVNIGQPLNSWSNNLAHETVHAILYRSDANGAAWRQEGPGSLPYQAAENLTRDAHAAPQK